MLVTERRLDMKVADHKLLARMMMRRGFTVRTLADLVDCSPATIGHLRSGKRNYVRDEWANAIEDALDLPRCSLFEPEVSTVTREVQRFERKSA